jgi:hypothetical protein
VGLVALLAACGDDGTAGGGRCTLRPLDEVPESVGIERLDVHTEPVAVVTLDEDASQDDLVALADAGGLDAAPAYPNQMVFSAPDGELSDRQMAQLFDAARAQPRFESIDGIICTEAG